MSVTSPLCHLDVMLAEMRALGGVVIDPHMADRIRRELGNGPVVEQLEWHESWRHDAYVSPHQSVGRSPRCPASAGVSSLNSTAVAESEAPATAAF